MIAMEDLSDKLNMMKNKNKLKALIDHTIFIK